MTEERVSYRNIIHGVVDEGELADDEGQQVGGHFLSLLKICLCQTRAINGDALWFCTREK